MTDKSAAHPPAPTSLPADDVEEVQGSLQDLDPYTLALRRARLKNMLENSLARYDSVMSRRLPSLAPGVKVRIVRGQLMHQNAVVKEADYITERALVQPKTGPAQWVHFGVLGPA
jgi:transcription antitermination factor NusG